MRNLSTQKTIEDIRNIKYESRNLYVGSYERMFEKCNKINIFYLPIVFMQNWLN
jgi:hypothetical protein